MSTPFKMKGSPMKRNFKVGLSKKEKLKNLASVDISKFSDKDKKTYYAKIKELSDSDVVKHKGKEY